MIKCYVARHCYRGTAGFILQYLLVTLPTAWYEQIEHADACRQDVTGTHTELSVVGIWKSAQFHETWCHAAASGVWIPTKREWPIRNYVLAAFKAEQMHQEWRHAAMNRACLPSEAAFESSALQTPHALQREAQTNGVGRLIIPAVQHVKVQACTRVQCSAFYCVLQPN